MNASSRQRPRFPFLLAALVLLASACSRADREPDPRVSLFPFEDAGIRHVYQTWNNCAGATLSMTMQLYGIRRSQAEWGGRLRSGPEDTSVMPREIQREVSKEGVRTVFRLGGSAALLRRLLSLKVPVMVRSWIIDSPEKQYGHYRLLVGYDADTDSFVFEDSLSGPRLVLDSRRFDASWRVFDRCYLAFLPGGPGAEKASARILALCGSAESAARAAYREAERETRQGYEGQSFYARGEDAAAFGYFNMGSSLFALGKEKDAARWYSRAFGLGLPWRTLWYQPDPLEAWHAAGDDESLAYWARKAIRPKSRCDEIEEWLGRVSAR